MAISQFVQLAKGWFLGRRSCFPKFVSYGQIRNTEILRYQEPDGKMSGVLFKYRGGIMTARHVVQYHNISGFISHEAQDLDIAYKADETCVGLPLGYTQDITPSPLFLLASSIDEPANLIEIEGRSKIFLCPLYYSRFGLWIRTFMSSILNRD
jgi:hypothetical protein